MSIRSAQELAQVDDPAWPLVSEWVQRRPTTSSALPVEPEAGRDTLWKVQVTARSPLGAVILNSGGILADGGWVRWYGAGHQNLPSIAAVNALRKPVDGTQAGALFFVGEDVLGGRFALDSGEVFGQPGTVCYFAPDTLEWENLEVSYSGLLEWFLSGGTDEFYADRRWDGWEEEISALPLDQGISLYPFPFTVEGKDISSAARQAVPMSELHSMYADLGQQLNPQEDEQ